jgi:hypothetical protein
MSTWETASSATAARWNAPAPREQEPTPTVAVAAPKRDAIYGPLLVLGIAAGEIAWLAALGYGAFHFFA